MRSAIIITIFLFTAGTALAQSNNILAKRDELHRAGFQKRLFQQDKVSCFSEEIEQGKACQTSCLLEWPLACDETIRIPCRQEPLIEFHTSCTLEMVTVEDTTACFTVCLDEYDQLACMQKVDCNPMTRSKSSAHHSKRISIDAVLKQTTNLK